MNVTDLSYDFITASLSSMGDGVILTGIDGKIVFTNKMAQTILGYTGNVAGADFESVFRLVHAETREEMEPPLFLAASAERPFGLNANSAIITKEGLVRYLSATFTPIKSGPDVLGVAIGFRDITRLKQWELRCRNEENNLRNIFNSAPVGMLILDHDATINDANDVALQIADKTKLEVLGQPVGRALCCAGSLEDERGCGFGRTCRSCDLRRGILLACRQGMAASPIECEKCFGNSGRKDNFWFRISITPISVNGTQNAVVTLIDITEAKRQEIEVTKSRDFYLNIFAGFPTIVWRSNVKQECLYLNSHWSDYTGQPADKGLAYGWVDFIHPEDRKAYFDTSLQAVRQGDNHEGEIRILSKEGQYRWFHCINRPFYNLEGHFDGFIGMGIDIHDRKVAEEDLTRYKILSEKVRDIILFVDIDGNIIEANEAAARAYEYSRAELTALTVMNLQGRGEVPAEQLYQADTEGVFFEGIHYRKDGTSFPVEVSSQGTVINNKRMLVNIIRDTTERKRAENLLRQSQKRYQTLFRNMNSGFVHLKVQPEGMAPADFQILEVNPTFERMFYVNAQDIVGNDLSRCFPYFWTFLTETLTASLKDKDTISIKIEEYYSVNYCAWYSVLIYEPEKGYLALIFNDITDKKIAAIQLEENRVKYHSLFMHMPNGFMYNSIVANEAGEPIDFIYLEVNDAYEKLIGRPKRDIVGQKFSELFPEKLPDYTKLIHWFGEVAYTGKSRVEREYYSTVSNRWYSMAAYSPERGYCAVIITDISDRKNSEKTLKKAKDEAESANKAKSEFLANMSHEIRTPINGIVGMIDLTLLATLDCEQRENLITAKSCANSLLSIINDILDFSKMEAGKLRIETVHFKVREFIEDVVKAHTHKARNKNIELNYKFSCQVPAVLAGDPNRIRQILNNLIDNAIKFTDTGEVSLTVKTGKQVTDRIELILSVADTGIGISQDDMNKLFRTFSQVDGSITRKYGGTGLGLAISKQLVEMMGGQIWVESSQGEGSVFYFALPLSIGDNLSEKPRTSSGLPRSSRPLNILLVEDDAVNQNVTKRLLEKVGHQVESVNHGHDALRLLERQSFDVVLMDIQMPVMDGIEATKRIREKGDDRHIPIIAMTAHAISGDRERFLSLGMDEYIAKPIQLNELIRKIDKVCSAAQHPASDIQIHNLRITSQGDLYFSANAKEMLDSAGLSIIQELLAGLNTAAREENLDRIETTAHKIKARAHSMDADELKNIAFKVELASRRGDVTQVMDYIRRLNSVFAELQKMNGVQRGG